MKKILKLIANKVCYRLLKTNATSNNSNYRKLSYSQSGEDLIVKFIFDELGIKKPSYIDVGAHHPYYFSNTAVFSGLGCTGINIEPDPDLFKDFLKDRPDDINLNLGISEGEDELDFYIMNVPTLNTFSKDEAEKCCLEGEFNIEKTVKIKTDNLQNIIAKYANGKFPDFLSVDAEGVDELIIDSIDFKKAFPTVICVETITFSASGNGVKNTELIEKIKNAGYIVYADTNINTIFVKEEKWKR